MWLCPVNMITLTKSDLVQGLQVHKTAGENHPTLPLHWQLQPHTHTSSQITFTCPQWYAACGFQKIQQCKFSCSVNTRFTLKTLQTVYMTRNLEMCKHLHPKLGPTKCLSQTICINCLTNSTVMYHYSCFALFETHRALIRSQGSILVCTLMKMYSKSTLSSKHILTYPLVLFYFAINNFYRNTTQKCRSNWRLTWFIMLRSPIKFTVLYTHHMYKCCGIILLKWPVQWSINYLFIKTIITKKDRKEIKTKTLFVWYIFNSKKNHHFENKYKPYYGPGKECIQQ